MEPDIQDGDLVLRPALGFAYQADLAAMTYKNGYLAKFDAYDRSIEVAVLAGRMRLVERHLPAGWTLLDYGSGSGAFVRYAINCGQVAMGYEVIPAARDVLHRKGLYSSNVEAFDAVTAWDVIEHLPKPQTLLARVRGFLFVSLPIFSDLARIRASKHYRPGEHLFYWSDAGFVAFLEEHGFQLLERSSHEVDAGREQIGAYAFRRMQ